MEYLFEHINWIVIAIGSLLTIAIYLYYKQTESRQLLNYTPNIWTSLGILGTFCCIVYTLSPRDGVTINWEDINFLVKGIIPAFETSIIGIIGAIITSIASKVIYAREDKDETDTYQKQFKHSPEQYIGSLDQQMSAINEKLGEQQKEGLLEKIDNLIQASKEQHDTMIKESKVQRLLTERLITDFIDNLKDFHNTIYKEEKLHMQELTEQYLGGINEIIKSTHGTIKEKFETLFMEHATALKKLMENEETQFVILSGKISKSIYESTDQICSAIIDIGTTQTDAIKIIVSESKEQLSQLAENNKQAVLNITLDNKTIISELCIQTKQNISKVTEEFYNLSNMLKNKFEILVKSLPTEIDAVKQEFITTIKSITEEKYNILTEDNKKLISQLLQSVEDYEKKVTLLSNKSQSQCLSVMNAELTKLLNRVDENVTGNMLLLKDSTKEIEDSLTAVSDTLKIATKDYKTLATQITTLVNALQKETDATEAYSNSVATTNTQLSTIQNQISDVINKNLQLRQELSQWKRTHKHVKVNTETGIKECPNCHTENPIDAGFCRKCATSFWKCVPIEISTLCNNKE